MRQAGAVHDVDHLVDVLVRLGLLLGEALAALGAGDDTLRLELLVDAAAARIVPRYACPSGLSTGAQASWRSGSSMPYFCGAFRSTARASSHT